MRRRDEDGNGVAACTACIGRSRTTRDTPSPRAANALLATLDETPSLRAGDALPPLFHWLHFGDITPTASLGADGHETLGTFLPPVPYPRRMWAGSELVFHRPLVLGREAERCSTIEDVRFTSGASGALCFVTVEHVHHQDGERCLTDRHTIVYRESDGTAAGDPVTTAGASSAGEPRARASVIAGTVSEDERSLDATVLFRYSALTFNAHRIHLDRDYARDVEGYPGLVVHGPLMATLLMRHALATRPSGTPSAFRFRARAPLFDGDGFRIVADDRDTGVDAGTALSLVRADGTTVMSATVDW